MAPRVVPFSIVVILFTLSSCALRGPITLKTGQSITRIVTLDGPSIDLQIHIPEGAIAHLTASQFEIDLALTTPAGLRVDRGEYGLETLFLQGQQPGPVTTVRITPATPHQPRRGRTTITLDWIRKPTPQDDLALLAQSEEARARDLIGQKTAATLALAQETYRNACRLWRDSGDTYSEARCLVPMGSALEKHGRYAEADQNYDRALQVLEPSGDRAAFLRTRKIWFNLGGHVGEQRAGLPELNAYRKELEQIGDRRAIASILTSIAKKTERLQEPASYAIAIDLYLQAASMQSALGDKGEEAAVWLQICGIQSSRQKLDEAAATIQKAVALAKESGDPSLEIDVLLSAEHFYGSQSKVKEELPLLRRLQELNRERGDQSGWLWATEHLCGVEAQLGHADAAWSHFQQARSERAVFAARNQTRPSATFFDGSPSPQNFLLNDLLHVGPERVLAFVDATRASFITSGYQERLREAMALVPPDTVVLEYATPENENRELITWAVTANRRVRVHLGPKGAATAQLADRVADQWALRRPETPQTQADRLQLAQTLLLAPLRYFPTTRRLVIVQDERFYRIPFAALPDPVRNDGSALGDHYEVVLTPSLQGVLAARQRRRAPAAGNKGAGLELALVTDPVMNPFDDRLAPEVRHSSRQPAISASSSAVSADWLPAARSAGIYNQSTGSFTRLTFGADEHDRLLQQFRTASPASRIADASGFAATRERVRDAAAQARIIHFATHGVSDLARPSRSGLVLSMWDPAGHPIDGYWTFDQIATQRLEAAELVTLGACETAIGRTVEHGHQGVPSLGHAFLRAGARRVISTLWKVDDAASSALMVEFYRILLNEKEKRPAVALWKAQQAISKRPHWDRPYYWAGFVLIGDWQSID